MQVAMRTWNQTGSTLPLLARATEQGPPPVCDYRRAAEPGLNTCLSLLSMSHVHEYRQERVRQFQSCERFCFVKHLQANDYAMYEHTYCISVERTEIIGFALTLGGNSHKRLWIDTRQLLT